MTIDLDALPTSINFGTDHTVAGIKCDGSIITLNLDGHTLSQASACTGLGYFLGVATQANGSSVLTINSTSEFGTLAGFGGVSIAEGESSLGELTIGFFGKLDLSAGGSLRIGSGPHANGIVRARGMVMGPSCTVAGGANGTGLLEVRPAGEVTLTQIAVGAAVLAIGELKMNIGSTLDAGTISIGTASGAYGTVGVADGTLTAGTISVGASVGAIGVLNVGDDASGRGTLTANSILLGNAGAVGTLRISGDANDEEFTGTCTAASISLGHGAGGTGTLHLAAGTLNVISLTIGNAGTGTFNRTGGTVTGLSSLTLGAEQGGSGVLHLDSPSQSLTFAGTGGQAQTVVGNGGTGELHVLGGAILRMLAAGTDGGLGIGIGSGQGTVKVSGFNSKIIGNDQSLLNVGNPWRAGQPALLIEDQGTARFGSASIGSDGADADVVVTGAGSALNLVLPGADSLPNPGEGLRVGNSARTASLLVSAGGHVNATSVFASSTHGTEPVIKVTGMGSAMDVSGPLYVAGEWPEGATMLVEGGATLTAVDTILGYAAGIGLPGDLTLDGPGQILTNTGTLTLGFTTQPNARGRLFLLNGATVHTHRLDVSGNYVVTNGTVNNPQLMVGGSPLLPPDIHCDTLLFDGMSTDIFNGFDVSIGAGAGIGGHGTWVGSFNNSNGGEVIATQAPIIPFTGESNHLDFTIAGNYTQDVSSALNVSCGYGFCSGCFGGSQRFVSSRLSVQGTAAIGGTLRLDRWTHRWGNFYASLEGLLPQTYGHAYEVLVADSIVGQFDSVEFAPNFLTNRVEVTYEPTRVLVTILPPVCDVSIQAQPIDDATCPGGTATFTLAAAGSPDGFGDPIRFEWQHYSGNHEQWFPIGDGDIGSLYFAQGTASPSLALVVSPQFMYEDGNQVPLRCIVSNECSSLTSTEVVLRVCRADFDCDGFVNSQDFFNFLTAFFSDAPAADFNHDTFINSQDFFDFLAAFFAGC